jgi:hypothetical protein
MCQSNFGNIRVASMSPNDAENCPDTHRVGRIAPLAVVLSLLAGACALSPAVAASRLMPADFSYLGAFRLPQGSGRPTTFEYGGMAMTVRPGGAKDGFPGSLFVMGHPRLAYGELPNGGQIAEITIPKPSLARKVGELPRARFLQNFHDVFSGRFKGLDEIQRSGLHFLDTPETGPLIHVAWGQHFQPDPPAPSHAWITPDLGHPEFKGEWFVTADNPYAVNGYLFEIPKDWANRHTEGRVLATGRFRDGGWSGLGPSLYAYRPWNSNSGASPPPGTKLASVVLLQYPTSRQTERMEHALANYQHPDEWEGGAWITTETGKTAVLFAGTKAIGAKYWYGFVNPQGSNRVCVHGPSVGEFPACREADGGSCPPSDMSECGGHNDARGWWSTHFAARFILYDPDDLAAVAAGRMKPWQPQPYAQVDLDRHLFHNPDAVETAMLGSGPQRRFRIGALAYDRLNGHLYATEPFADGVQPVIHVWRVR